MPVLVDVSAKEYRSERKKEIPCNKKGTAEDIIGPCRVQQSYVGVKVGRGRSEPSRAPPSAIQPMGLLWPGLGRKGG